MKKVVFHELEKNNMEKIPFPIPKPTLRVNSVPIKSPAGVWTQLP